MAASFNMLFFSPLLLSSAILFLQPMRRAAIKVKRSKTFTGVGPGNSSSDIIKQRAREAREASRSPPPFLAAALGTTKIKL